jgi:hypothetical protein
VTTSGLRKAGMKVKNKILARIAWSCLLTSWWSGGVLPAVGQQTSTDDRPQVVTHSDSAQPPSVERQDVQEGQDKLNALPDSPGASLARSQDQLQQQSGNPPQPPSTRVSTQIQADSQTPSSPPQQVESPQPNLQKPVGTAAAEAPNMSGVAASQPAGVAIAPAKQRRLRTIILRTGAIIGAGVAVGTVVALTAATPSKPPGAH